MLTKRHSDTAANLVNTLTAVRDHADLPLLWLASECQADDQLRRATRRGKALHTKLDVIAQRANVD